MAFIDKTINKSDFGLDLQLSIRTTHTVRHARMVLKLFYDNAADSLGTRCPYFFSWTFDICDNVSAPHIWIVHIVNLHSKQGKLWYIFRAMMKLWTEILHWQYCIKPMEITDIDCINLRLQTTSQIPIDAVIYYKIWKNTSWMPCFDSRNDGK